MTGTALISSKSPWPRSTGSTGLDRLQLARPLRPDHVHSIFAGTSRQQPRADGGRGSQASGGSSPGASGQSGIRGAQRLYNFPEPAGTEGLDEVGFGDGIQAEEVSIGFNHPVKARTGALETDLMPCATSRPLRSGMPSAFNAMIARSMAPAARSPAAPTSRIPRRGKQLVGDGSDLLPEAARWLFVPL